MVKTLLRIITIVARMWIRQRWTASLNDWKFKGIRAYVLGVRTSRRMAGLYFMVLFTGVSLFAACILLFTGLMILAPWSLETKAYILVGSGGLGIILSVIVIVSAFSERRWLKLFHVNALLRNATTHSEN
jgi:hypothetical protein